MALRWFRRSVWKVSAAESCTCPTIRRKLLGPTERHCHLQDRSTPELLARSALACVSAIYPARMPLTAQFNLLRNAKLMCHKEAPVFAAQSAYAPPSDGPAY